MDERDILLAALLDDAGLTLEEFSRACAVEREWVVSHVREGLLPALDPDGPERWRFTSVHVRRAREMHRLERDFDAVPELAALVADLIEEVEALRGRLRRAGLD
ncbi:MAG TPA: chaperone modulator CbpM [Casimicrobiaceae bacterium]|nr:chaperone modulator CbpM [Casimicrobiaceae bacterium]